MRLTVVVRLLALSAWATALAACGGLIDTQGSSSGGGDAGVAAPGPDAAAPPKEAASLAPDADASTTPDVGAGALGDPPCAAGACPSDRVCNPVTNLCEAVCDVAGAVDPAAPWPMFGGCPTNRGVSRFAGPTATP
jgi:hypothetical protein